MYENAYFLQNLHCFYKKSPQMKLRTIFNVYLFFDVFASFLSIHHDHVTGATKSDEYVPEISPNTRGTEKLRSES